MSRFSTEIAYRMGIAKGRFGPHASKVDLSHCRVNDQVTDRGTGTNLPEAGRYRDGVNVSNNTSGQKIATIKLENDD